MMDPKSNVGVFKKKMTRKFGKRDLEEAQRRGHMKMGQALG